jgi:ubiquinone/menaquinone biosynthesis C-methylase UbiE
LINQGGSLTCIDISKDWMKIAKHRMRHYNNVDFKIGDILKMEINPNSYDAVYIHYVLHDIPFSQRQKIIEKLVYLLKKDGKLYIREPIKKSHGMPEDEILQIMQKCNLSETTKESDKTEFSGIFQK